MPRSAIDLTALIGSRICHDLSSPIGAINNGVELIAAVGGAASPELELIAQSAASANAKLRFFRIAFGGTANHAEIAATEVQNLCREMFGNGRLHVGTHLGIGGLTRSDAKLLLLLVLCLESVLPIGGRIDIFNEASTWRLVAAGEKLQLNPDLWSLLCEGRRTAMIGAPQVQFALARRMLEALGIGLATELRQNSFEIKLQSAGSSQP